MNKLRGWRLVLSRWQLGPRPKEDPEAQAVRVHWEATLALRAEVSALTLLLLKNGVVVEEDLDSEIANACAVLDRQYEAKFPGFRTTSAGVVVDQQVASQTVKDWRK